MELSRLRPDPAYCGGTPIPGRLTQTQIDTVLRVVAEDMLSGEKDQWPVRVPPSQALRGGRGNRTLEQAVDDILGEADARGKKGHPEGAVLSPLFLMRRESASTQPSGLHATTFRKGQTSAEGIRFDRVISSGTAQGVVYAVTLVGPPGKPLPKGYGVGAVLKKSPLYPVATWYQHVAIKQLLALVRSKGVAALSKGGRRAGGSPEARMLAVNLLSWRALLADGSEEDRRRELRKEAIKASARLDELVAAGQRAAVSRLSEQLGKTSAILADSYNNPNNESYIDAAGYYLGSRLVEGTKSPGYGLLYGTYRADDTSFFDDASTAKRVLGDKALSSDFPVQATVLQWLGDDVNHLIEKGFFGGWGKPLRRDRAMALFAQVTMALAAGQHYFGLVHNDLHAGNVLHEAVPECTVLYYVDPSSGAAFAVPTFGKVYKVIDFGRARFVIPGWGVYGGTVQRDVWHISGKPEWNDAGRSNDMLRFVSAFLSYTGTYPEVSEGPEDDGVGLARFVRRVMSCGNQGGPFERAQRCEGDERCERIAFDRDPFVVGSECTHADPVDLIGYMGAYAIDPREIPKGAPVYEAFSR